MHKFYTQKRFPMFDNAIAVPASLAGLLATRPPEEEKDFDSVAKGADFLPRLQLTQATSELVKDEKVGAGHWVLVLNKEDFIDLGKEAEITVYDWRAKAMRTTKPVVSYYDRHSAEFKGIQSQSGVANSGCMAGPEFLVYVHSQQKLATLFMSSTSMQREAKNVKPEPGSIKQVLLGVGKADNGKNKWSVPTVQPVAAPLDFPSDEATVAVVTDFKNPKSGPEAVPQTPVAGAGRPQ